MRILVAIIALTVTSCRDAIATQPGPKNEVTSNNTIWLPIFISAPYGGTKGDILVFTHESGMSPFIVHLSSSAGQSPTAPNEGGRHPALQGVLLPLPAISPAAPELWPGS